jgi:hypothetical protein
MKERQYICIKEIPNDNKIIVGEIYPSCVVVAINYLYEVISSDYFEDATNIVRDRKIEKILSNE